MAQSKEKGTIKPCLECVLVMWVKCLWGCIFALFVHWCHLPCSCYLTACVCVCVYVSEQLQVHCLHADVAHVLMLRGAHWRRIFMLLMIKVSHSRCMNYIYGVRKFPCIFKNVLYCEEKSVKQCICKRMTLWWGDKICSTMYRSLIKVSILAILLLSNLETLGLNLGCRSTVQAETSNIFHSFSK